MQQQIGAALNPFGVTAQTGYDPGPMPANAVSALDKMPGLARSTVAAPHSLLSTTNPLTWFAGIAAVTFGLVAFTSTVRVGRARGRVSIGKE